MAPLLFMNDRVRYLDVPSRWLMVVDEAMLPLVGHQLMNVRTQ